MFSDEFIRMDSNTAIISSLIDAVMAVKLPHFATLPVGDYRYMPDLSALSEKPFQSWKHMLEPVPDDIIKLTRLDLYDGGLCHKDEIERAHAALGIPCELPTGIIKPAYEIPKFSYIPAVPLPVSDSPPLELNNPEIPAIVRLSQLSNSCSDDDLETFLIEGAKLADLGSSDPKEILKLIARKVLS